MLNWHEFVAALGGLFVQSCFEPLFPHDISFLPKRAIVFDVVFNIV
jgi:hypothetical protein